MVCAAVIFMCFRWPDLTKGKASSFDAIVLLIFFGLLLCPIFAEVNLFGLKLKQQIKGLEDQISQQISSLATEVRSTVTMNVIQSSTQAAPGNLPDKASEASNRTPMELKILNTLWTKQVNRFDDLSRVWSFRLNVNAAEFIEFRDAATRLIREGFVSETAQGQIHLTVAGFDYCRTHYEEFPDEQWWPEDPIKPDRLKVILGES